MCSLNSGYGTMKSSGPHLKGDTLKGQKDKSITHSCGCFHKLVGLHQLTGGKDRAVNSFPDDLSPMHGGMGGGELSPFVVDTDRDNPAFLTCPSVPPNRVDPLWSFLWLK